MKWLLLLVTVFSTLLLSGCSVFDKDITTGLQVMTHDIPSSVFVNGQFLEKTPAIEKNLPPGEYSVKILPDDPEYVPYETTILLRKGLLSVITWKPGKTPETSGGVVYEMEPLKVKQESEISFITIPDGAIVKLDDKEKEFSPIIFPDIAAGHHTYEVTLPSYETQNHTINAVPGFRMVVKIKLAKLQPSATVQESSTSAVPTAEAVVQTEATASSRTRTASISAATGKQVKILPTQFFVDNKEVLKVRQQPLASSPEIGMVEVGLQYPFLAENNGWYQIEFDETKGWISTRYAQLEE